VGQEDLSAKEEFVVVAASVLSSSKTLEPVQVQLTLERSELTQFEVSGKELDKFLGLVNDEASSMRLPGNDVRETIGLNSLQHLVKLQRERGGYTPASGVFLLVVRAAIICVVMVVVLNNDVSVVSLALVHLLRERLWLEGAQIEGLVNAAKLILDCYPAQKGNVLDLPLGTRRGVRASVSDVGDAHVRWCFQLSKQEKGWKWNTAVLAILVCCVPVVE